MPGHPHGGDSALPPDHPVQQIADMCGGKVTSVMQMPDGSGGATVTFPLRSDHWIYGPSAFNVPPMVMRMGHRDRITFGVTDQTLPPEGGTITFATTTWTKQEMRQAIVAAGKYAVKSATMNGADMDFDPDALIQNLVVGFLGYFTETGLDKEDSWANPSKPWEPRT